jgi:hypothetical protein
MLTNNDFGIRDGGDRAAICNALLKANGKPVAATKLARLARGKTTRRVARVIRRIARQGKFYRLGVKVTHDDVDGVRVYIVKAKRG